MWWLLCHSEFLPSTSQNWAVCSNLLQSRRMSSSFKSMYIMPCWWRPMWPQQHRTMNKAHWIFRSTEILSRRSPPFTCSMTKRGSTVVSLHLLHWSTSLHFYHHHDHHSSPSDCHLLSRFLHCLLSDVPHIYSSPSPNVSHTIGRGFLPKRKSNLRTTLIKANCKHCNKNAYHMAWFMVNANNYISASIWIWDKWQLIRTLGRDIAMGCEWVQGIDHQAELV